jgi:hypothetical protein
MLRSVLRQGGHRLGQHFRSPLALGAIPAPPPVRTLAFPRHWETAQVSSRRWASFEVAASKPCNPYIVASVWNRCPSAAMVSDAMMSQKRPTMSAEQAWQHGRMPGLVP